MRVEAVARRDALARTRVPARWKARLKRGVVFALFALVLWLLARYAREVDWPAVAGVLRGYRASTLALAAALALASHALYGCFDLIGRLQLRHGLPPARVMATACVSYAFNLNLGALVGGVAMRYRLYTRQGLPVDTITEVLALSMIGNWLGWLLLAGIAFTGFAPALPAGWELGRTGLRLLGALLLALAAAYVGACFFARRRVWRWRRLSVTLPSGRVALLQLALSGLNWMLIAGVVAVLLQQRVDYPDVLAVLLIAAVAGVITHVPAGLGVLEAVFIALLSQRVPQAELLAALLAYRAIYYLAPLGLALGVYLWLEAQARRAAALTAAKQPGSAACSAHGA